MTQKPFKPWVGKHYNETRLLLLGGNNQRRDPIPRVKKGLDNFGSADDRFMEMLSQGLTAKDKPSKEQLYDGWHRVAFANYIGGTTGEGPGRPTDAMRKEAKRALLNILNELRPRPWRIIVLGKTMWRKMPETDRHITNDVQGYELADGSVAVCWALPRNLSGTRLADTIHFALGRELPRSGS